MKPYDICVITAANSRQAEGYRKQLSWRTEQGLLPDTDETDTRETEFLVYADAKGKRIGSGGSTIYVLCKLLEDHGYNLEQVTEFYEKKRILILHSGGDSRRLPAYSAVGKIFTPLPTEKYLALFDVLLDNFMRLPLLDDGQVIVTSGDVLLSFEPDYVDFSDTGVTGVAYPDSPDVASNHGVYVVIPNHSEGNPRKVIDFLQKPDLEKLEEACALDHAERAFVDTGIMNFALDAVERLIEASISTPKDSPLIAADYITQINADRTKINKNNKKISEDQRYGVSKDQRAIIQSSTGCPTLYEQILDADIKLDLYQEFTFAMLGKTDNFTASEQFREIPFFVNLLPYCDFFHIGKSKEFLQNFHTITHASALYDFRNFTRSNVEEHVQLKDAFVYNTLIDTNFINLAEPVFIEGCHLDGEVELVEGENILTGVPRGAGDISLQKGICMTVLPIRETEGEDPNLRQWVSIIYGIDDSFKYTVDEDEECSFLNIDFFDWMKDNGVSPDELWEENESHELWNARLFLVSSEPMQVVKNTLTLQDGTFLPQWEDSNRMSLQEVLQAVDYGRLLEGYLRLDQKTKLRNIKRTLTPDSSLSSEEISSWCHEQEDYEKLVKDVTDMIERSDDLLFQARLYKLLSNLFLSKTEVNSGNLPS